MGTLPESTSSNQRSAASLTLMQISVAISSPLLEFGNSPLPLPINIFYMVIDLSVTLYTGLGHCKNKIQEGCHRTPFVFEQNHGLSTRKLFSCIICLWLDSNILLHHDCFWNTCRTGSNHD